MTAYVPGAQVCVSGWGDAQFTVVYGPFKNLHTDTTFDWYLVSGASGSMPVEGDLMHPAAAYAPPVDHGTSVLREGMLYVKLDKTWWFAHSWLKAPVQDDEHYR